MQLNLQHVILGFLLAEPLTGYDLNRRIEQSVSHFFDISLSAIYPALRRMEKDGLIDKTVVPQEGKPNKNLFAITEEGRAEFQRYLGSSVAPTVMRSDLFIRLFFGTHCEKEQLINWIEEERDRVQQQLEQLRATKLEKQAIQMDLFKQKLLLIGIEKMEFDLKLLERELHNLMGEDQS